MNTKEIINALRDLLGKHEGSEKELLEALDGEAEGWRMRLQELDGEDEYAGGGEE